MDGEYPLPAAGAPGKDEEPGFAIRAGRGQHPHARPVGVAKTGRALFAGIERGIDTERKEKEGEDEEEHFLSGAHGGEWDVGSRLKYGVCHRPCTMEMRHSGTLKARNVGTGEVTPRPLYRERVVRRQSRLTDRPLLSQVSARPLQPHV